MNHWVVLAIFSVTYVGIAIGGLPGLALDRTGTALVGAIALVLASGLTITDAAAAVDIPTILLLYALMVVSAQFRVGGFYTRVALRVVRFAERPKVLLAALILASAGLSALLANDIVCLAFTPVLCVALMRARLNPVPFLLALACASNVGSAATIIGNPQNMLIGQVGRLDFAAFLLWCGPPSVLGLGAIYLVISRLYRNRWLDGEPSEAAAHKHPGEADDAWPEYDRHQTTKAIALTSVLVALFFTPIPRELSAIAVAGVLLASRRIHSRRVLGFVDWHLITLFGALFVVVRAFQGTGVLGAAIGALEARGINLAATPVLGAVTVVLSNLVSNVPATMLLVGHLPAGNPVPWYVLALSSTLAGNLILVGSIANLIVVEQAQVYGVVVSFREHVRTGVPVTLATLAIAWGWVELLGALGG